MTIRLGKKELTIPLIQGGMGVGISRSSLAGAVAACGGMGVISTAQIGYDEPDFATDYFHANNHSIAKHIRIAKEKACGHGMIAVNIMHALADYEAHIHASIAAGVDAIICGAGLPMELPEIVGDAPVCIAPIVSSKRAAALILRIWKKKYSRFPDFVVIEGPNAGGHLGFHPDDLTDIEGLHFDDEIRSIVSFLHEYAKENEVTIPVFAAGGIMTHEDVLHMQSLGVDGVQVATRFVATSECDASETYKQAYCAATQKDVTIIKSPVGMPGRALCNNFVKRSLRERIPVSKCYHCIRGCKPAEIPYCITKALIDAVNGDVENGLIFCGANVGQIHEISTVPNVIAELLDISAAELIF